MRQQLEDPLKFGQHPAMVQAGQSTVSDRGLILLAWLHLVGNPLLSEGSMSSDMFWLARNAKPVLDALGPMSESQLIGESR